MIPLHAYRGRAAGVFGLGKAGEVAAAALIAGGAEVYAWDDGEGGRNSLAEKFPAAKIIPLAQWPWQSLASLVLSPGVPYTHPAPHEAVKLAQAAGVEIVGDVELLFRAQPNAFYVGITGTNGKSTTTALIAHILREAGRRVEVGGNLGTPALALAPLNAGEIYVLEMSSYQLDLVRSVRFNVAVLLNLTPDHLDRHGDMAGYLAAKLRIFERQQADDCAVVAVDDEYTRAACAKISGGGPVQVSAHRALEKGVYVESGVLHDMAFARPDPRLVIQEIPTLQGRHNWQNAAVAYAACRALDVSPERILRGMESFPGLAHRMEQVGEISGVRFVNDSKATNADATANALAAYDVIYWIAGGKQKAGGIESLGAFFPRLAHVFLIGEAEEEFARTLAGKAPFTRCGTLERASGEAFQMARKDGRKGAVVLLSPACASFDQFKSFEHRGDVFRAWVKALVAGENHAA